MGWRGKLILACAVGALAGAPPAMAADRAPALFKAGAASASIDPDPAVPVYSGGFGKSPAITKTYAHLSARAMYVANGTHAVLFATVDSQAYFASYQEGPESGSGPKYGITDIRRLAAAQITALGGPKVTQADIIVQGTHSHSAATLEGIWGPVPIAYLKKVHDQTIRALVDAARAAQPARLQWATVNAPELDNIVTAQTDSYPGWSQDGQLSVLRAVRPDDGATIGLYANIPAHPDIVNGAGLRQLGADYFGAVREALERQLGGVAVVAGATLGREESPVQVGGLNQMQWYARVVTNLVDQGLARARWISDPTLASKETFASIPGINPALLALVAAWQLPDAQKQQMLDTTGLYPVDRDNLPPYQTANVIGTYLTALRVGGLVYLSMPGEPFPEVRYSIANGTGGEAIIALSKGQDDLGYFYPAWVYGFTYAYPSDHNIYNVAPQAGDQVIQGQLANIAALGFATGPGVPAPLATDFPAALHPGLQALASAPTGDAGANGSFTTTLQAIYEPASIGNTLSNTPVVGMNDPLGLTNAATPVHWKFGDGKEADTSFKSFGSPEPPGTSFVPHAYQPGKYTVEARAQGKNGDVATWTLPVTVYPCLEATVSGTQAGPSTFRYTAAASGGQGTVLATRWTFSDGATADGAAVTHTFAGNVAPGATVTIVDGTGTLASATTDASGAQASPPSCGAAGVAAASGHLPDTSAAPWAGVAAVIALIVGAVAPRLRVGGKRF